MAAAPFGKAQDGVLDDVHGDNVDPVLNQSTVAKAFGVHKSTIHRWLLEGALLAERNPKGILKVRKSTVVNFLASSKWAGNEDVLKRLNDFQEAEEDGDTKMVGKSSSGKASEHDHDRRNRRNR